MRYIEYFGPEINEILTEEFIRTYFNEHKEVKKEEIVKRIPKENEEEFCAKRKIGENDKILCELIRHKKTKDFIAYVILKNQLLTCETLFYFYEKVIIIAEKYSLSQKKILFIKRSIL